MELRLHHIIHLYNVLHENGGKENCAQVLEEEVYKMFGTKCLNDEHDCYVVSMNSLNIHSTNDDCTSYDEIMPPTYDDYIDESGFGEVMTLFSDESITLEEVSIDYDNKVAIYDGYCDDLYAIRNNDNHETFHHDFSFQLDYASHDSYSLRPKISDSKLTQL